MKKTLLIIGSLALSTNVALADTTVKTFTINGSKVNLNVTYAGTACPAQFYFESKGKESDYFGTCLEGFEKIVQKGNKIILTMNGFRGPFESESEKKKAFKELYQYTYYNGKITEKRIK